MTVLFSECSFHKHLIKKEAPHFYNLFKDKLYNNKESFVATSHELYQFVKTRESISDIDIKIQKLLTEKHVQPHSLCPDLDYLVSFMFM